MTLTVRGALAAHRALPWPLRAWAVAPAILALVIAGGTLFTLPPGPLCHEGMVLLTGMRIWRSFEPTCFTS